MGPGGPPPGMMGPGGPPPGMMMGPGGPPPGMMGPGGPGMYDPDSMGGAGVMGPSGDMMGCPPEGMGSYGHGHGRNGLLGDVLGILAPYSDGGCGAPRWYDFELGVMSLKRDNAGTNVAFASQGAGGPIVLETDDLDFDSSTSFKFSAMMQWGPGSNLEFTYFGLFGWTEQAVVNSATGSLFSPYSDFGLDPIGGFPETDEAELASIRYFSTFDNFEINHRSRWQSPNCRYQGSWLYGVRYFQLDEDFNYLSDNNIQNPPLPGPILGLPVASQRTNINTNNALTGIQVGGDVWICLLPGLRFGGEGKFGVFGNHANIDTTIVTSGGDVFTESLTVGDVSFIGDVAAYATYRINYNWTFKAGYQALYVEGVSLAGENFNAEPPGIFTGGASTRVANARENGNVFYHGFTATAEYLW